MSTVTLYHGDCLEVMRGMADKSIDCVVTDPPYGIGNRRMRNCVGFMDVTWDLKPATDEMIKECLRISKNQIIFGGNYFDLPATRCVIVWDKGETMHRRSWAECEIAWTNFDEVSRIIKITSREEKEHPTQKPLNLMTWVLENYTKPDDTVLDCFMGSGTTGVACVKTNRNFIGIELDENYFNIAERRIKEAQMQPNLFHG